MPAAHREDIGPWMHGTVVNHRSQDHDSRLYRICVVIIGHIITRTAHHVRQTLICVEEYLRSEIHKSTQAQTDIDFD